MRFFRTDGTVAFATFVNTDLKFLSKRLLHPKLPELLLLFLRRSIVSLIRPTNNCVTLIPKQPLLIRRNQNILRIFFYPSISRLEAALQLSFKTKAARKNGCLSAHNWLHNSTMRTYVSIPTSTWSRIAQRISIFCAVFDQEASDRSD